MNLFRYTIKSFLYYFRLNLAVILGVALSMAILLGAFVIGDSVKYSLQQITINRLGRTNQVITAGERLFRSDLSTDLNDTHLEITSLLRANGMAIFNGGESRANQLQVWGVDTSFNYFAGTDSCYSLSNGEAVINEHLATILGIEAGQELLIRVNKLSTFPSNTPFVAADETSISFRVTIKEIVKTNQTGNFNLQNIQSSPKNIFVSQTWLNQQLDLENKANVILINIGNISEAEVFKKLSDNWKLEDINLEIRQNRELGYSELVSKRVFIEPEIEKTCTTIFQDSYPVFTYFVNEFRHGEQVTPYSFVSGLPAESTSIDADEIIVNEWLASDLNVKVGDTITLNYFVIGPLRKLEVQNHRFIIKDIVPLTGKWDDQLLMPDIPGLSDAGHCSDWETGIPVDLSSIRQKDEDYWNHFKGTPKAFVNLNTAKKLWQNRFGASTSLRINFMDDQLIKQKILEGISPSTIGFQVTDAKKEGLQAASNGVDFGELFIGLSFFVLLAALMLTYLMFKLSLNFRKQEVETLQAIGFTTKKIRSIFLSESIFIIITGILLGTPLGLAYNNLILKAIGTIWHDIVQTSFLQVYVSPLAIIKATAIIFSISISTIWLILRKSSVNSIKSSSLGKTSKKNKIINSLSIGLLLLIGSTALLILMSVNKGEVNPSVFFASGFGLLPAFILLLNAYFKIQQKRIMPIQSLKALVLQQIHFNRKNNILLVSFLSIGIFLVLSTGLNRKDLTRNSELPSSGTGGYAFFAKTSLPILIDLNSDKGKFEFGLEKNKWDFVQFRTLQGDDASCLNLNRISRPQVLGFAPQTFDKKKAFTFISKSKELDEEHPWLSLNNELPNGQIPAIADETVIKWGLGKTIGDTLSYKNESGENITLKLIGGLSNSIFQGNVLIAEKYFLKNFPSISGSQVLLADGDRSNNEQLKTSFRNYGVEVTPAKDRLLQFYQVENTYLTIFLQLGALGLLIGTIGLGIVIFRSLLERRSEFAIMKATGYTKRKLYTEVFAEYLLVVSISILIGTLPAVISALPSLLSSIYQGLFYWAVVVDIIVLASASFWILIAGKLAIKEPLGESLRND